NDGDEWQPLRLNMPATSIRDLVVHRDDIVVGTHGRSFWILDDITPLRQIDASVASSDAFLFAPQTAYRVRRNLNTDTPLPPEEPAGQNPPDGAIINYYLKTDSGVPVQLEIFDRAGKLVRRFRSDDKPEYVDEKELPYPLYWVRPPRVLPASAGMQRFVWDLHYPDPGAQRHEYPISAIYRDTPRSPQGASVLPGDYTLKLTAAGKTFTRTLRVEMDPRVKTTRAGLEQQFALSAQAAEGMTETSDVLDGLKKIRTQVADLRKRAGLPPAVGDALTAFDKKAAALESGAPAGTTPAPPNFNQLHTQLASLYEVLQQADAAPTTQAAAQAADLQRRLREAMPAWNEFKSKDVEALNAQLRTAGLPAVTL
ncbi:MAG: glycoside hydrolase, partial [Acidobacteria bacterium]|nr:glycoside hydrolase [Acidobacteriota bacterium]